MIAFHNKHFKTDEWIDYRFRVLTQHGYRTYASECRRKAKPTCDDNDYECDEPENDSCDEPGDNSDDYDEYGNYKSEADEPENDPGCDFVDYDDSGNYDEEGN